MASAAPNPAPVSSPVNELETRASINNCGDSTFVNQSSGGSPRVEDCLRIARNIAGGGTWSVALIGHHQLVEYGTCAFGVKAPFELGVSNIRIGNQDIIDVINDSVRRFQWNGRVGAKGEMKCQSDPGGIWHKTDWGIYHN
ncbi:putative necrosis-inducing factor-domain-containing protein [Panaeolus papilionaceus]|nr:putative necrosis-inducing factor-domain-containing protein [Panaeolus papilionaceus]